MTDIANTYELPGATLLLELKGPSSLTEEDIEMAEYYLAGFKKVIEAKLRKTNTGRYNLYSRDKDHAP